MGYPSLLEVAQHGHLKPNDYISGSVLVVPMVDGKAKCRIGYMGTYEDVSPWLAKRFSFPCLFTFERKQYPTPRVWRGNP